MATALAREVEVWVKEKLSGYDASHDFQHVDRVRNMALHLAEKEGIADTELVEIGALVHDVDDFKYSGSEIAGIDNVARFLAEKKYPQEKADKVVRIVEGVSFRKEIGGGAAPPFPELAVVQDADRLDAIGAIGIARCIAFGGARGRPLYDDAVKPIANMTREDYMAQTETKSSVTINHFYEKLLRLKDMMKTAAGREVAAGRHQFMEEYLDRFHRECAGTA